MGLRVSGGQLIELEIHFLREHLWLLLLLLLQEGLICAEVVVALIGLVVQKRLSGQIVGAAALEMARSVGGLLCSDVFKARLLEEQGQVVSVRDRVG